MATTQLNCRVEVLLAKRLREAATARHTTTGALVAQAIEALLAGNSASPAPPPSALAALEARVARLEAANQGCDYNLENNGGHKSHDNIMAFHGINPDNIRVKNNDESRVCNAKATKDQPAHDIIMDGIGYHGNVVRSQSTTQGPDNIRTSQGGSKTISSQEGVTIVTPSQGITTPELAIQTGTSKGAWNTWARKATIGDIRHHPIAGSWRLLGKAALASGGPPRWLWEAEG
jgi:hypothetical protein